MSYRAEEFHRGNVRWPDGVKGIGYIGEMREMFLLVDSTKRRPNTSVDESSYTRP